MNVIHLIGRATRDVELSYTPDGKALAKVGLAVDKFGKDKGASFFNLVAWEKKAETLSQYLKKGHLLYVSGRMESRDFTNDKGEKRTFWDVTVNDFQFLTKKDGGAAPASRPAVGEGEAQGDPFSDDLPI